MAISAQMVKQLRDITGAGMMDCKKALIETDGDIDEAVEYLQVKGMAKAAKKSGRVAAEGLVATVLAEDAESAVIVEVNCETDFVSRNEQFHEFVDTVSQAIASGDVQTVEEAQSLTVNGESLEKVTKDAVSTIGENIQLRRFTRFSQPEGFIASYTHAGNQIAVLVSVKVDGSASEEQQEFGRDVAMHIAAMNPRVLVPDDIDQETAQKQEELIAAQVAEEGKPENIVPRIVEGKMGKWKKEQSLLEQAFVKNPDLSVGKLQDQIGGVRIADFVRYEVGEGIEKEEANLADEVAAQLKGDA